VGGGVKLTDGTPGSDGTAAAGPEVYTHVLDGAYAGVVTDFRGWLLAPVARALNHGLPGFFRMDPDRSES
jgi:hypothetical protein